MNQPDDIPKSPVDQLATSLEAKGLSREEILRVTQNAAAAQEQVIQVAEDDALAVISAKLDKLQKSVDGLAAKLDAEDPR
ncbi:MAG: hypothetical protein U0R26_03580 [Solirubrobacterales bacterium]